MAQVDFLALYLHLEEVKAEKDRGYNLEVRIK